MFGAESVMDDEGGPSNALVQCPYDRSIITVVGPNHNLHDQGAWFLCWPMWQKRREPPDRDRTHPAQHFDT